MFIGILNITQLLSIKILTRFIDYKKETRKSWKWFYGANNFVQNT